VGLLGKVLEAALRSKTIRRKVVSGLEALRDKLGSMEGSTSHPASRAGDQPLIPPQLSPPPPKSPTSSTRSENAGKVQRRVAKRQSKQ
jgi:hypothetical protein